MTTYFGAYNQTRKVMTAFMDFFSNMTIQKYKTDPISGIIPHKFVRVPIQWASTEKWLQVLRSQTGRKGFSPDVLERNPVEMQWQLPRMSVNLTNMSYDPMRHLIKTNQISDYLTKDDLTGKTKQVFAPVPYTLDVDLGIIARNIDECLQIVEQILPFFSPSLSVDVKLFDDKPSESIPFILSSVSPDITDEIMETDERIFTFNLTFNIKMNYYLPKRLSGVIKQVNTNIFTTGELEDSSYEPFEQYVQIAKNPDPYGDFEDRADITLNPVETIVNELQGIGTWSPTASTQYKDGDVVIYNDMRIRYVEAADIWVILGPNNETINEAKVMLNAPTSADNWIL